MRPSVVSESVTGEGESQMQQRDGRSQTSRLNHLLAGYWFGASATAAMHRDSLRNPPWSVVGEFRRLGAAGEGGVDRVLSNLASEMKGSLVLIGSTA